MTYDGRELAEVDLDLIEISPQNVRKRDLEVGIDELASSIEKVGLLQPLVVVKKGDGFELVVGQRRFHALQKLRQQGRLDRAKVPALVYDNLSDAEKVILSLSENLERRDLSFRDYVDAVKLLYDEFGSIPEVAKKLGVSPPTVYRYLRYAELPDEIKKMVDEKIIFKEDARRALIASKGDADKAIEIARNLPEMTTDQKTKLVADAEANPEASVEELVKRAQTREKVYRITIVLPEDYYSLLEAASEDLRLDAEATATKAVVDWLEKSGYRRVRVP